MKILIAQDILRSGGTERQTILLARAFTAEGHSVEVLTFRPGGTLAPLLATIPHHCLQPFDTRWSWWAPGLIRTARANAPDVVLCMGRMANCHAGRLAKALPEAVVIGTLRTGKPLPWLFRRSLHQVAHIVANSSESSRLLIDEHRLPASRVSVIHNALVFPSTPADPAHTLAMRTRHRARPETHVLLCVGMLRPEKNQRALIEIAASLGAEFDWQLWLAGDGPARSDCEILATRLGVADRVKFLGFQADPTPLYHAANLAVLASKAESLSNFLIEAQAHGLPAVAYAATGVSECLRNGISGWAIEPGDAEAFRAALQPLLNDASARARASEAAGSFAREAFEPTRQARAYLTLFIRLRAAKAS